MGKSVYETQNLLERASNFTLADVFISQYGGPNKGGQEDFCKSQKHEKILSGANHSGKTYMGVMEAALHTIPAKDKYGKNTGYTINPYYPVGIPAHGTLGWFSTYSSQVQKSTLQPVVDKIFKPYFKSEPYMEDGAYQQFATETSTIQFRNQTAGVSTYTGAKVDWIHMDEPHEKPIYNECKARIALRMGYMWTTLTPVIDPTDPDLWKKIKYVEWMLDDLINPFIRDPESLPELDVFFIALRENKFIPNFEFIENLYAAMPDEERHIRLTGKFVGTSKLSLFSDEMLEHLDNYITSSHVTPQYGFLEYDPKETNDTYKFIFVESDVIFPDKPKESWMIKVWEHPLKEELGICPDYFIGVDAAEGKNTGDYTSVHVRRKDTGAIVAVLHGFIDELTLAYELWKLGHYYSNRLDKPASIAIETNNAGKSTLSNLLSGNSNIGIPEPYPRSSLYRRPNIRHLQQNLHIPSSDFGWYTTPAHREYLLTSVRNSFLKAYRELNNGLCLIPDRGLLDEAKKFIRHENGKYQAAKGFHDDRLMSYAISEMAIKQGSFTTPVYKPKISKEEEKSRYLVKPEGIYLNLRNKVTDKDNVPRYY